MPIYGDLSCSSSGFGYIFGTPFSTEVEGPTLLGYSKLLSLFIASLHRNFKKEREARGRLLSAEC